MKVSLLMLTINRFEITTQTFEKNMSNHGWDGEIELLICDNASTDPRIIEYFNERADYHRVNRKNEGCNKSFNQLFLRSTGDFICLLGNDIEMDDGWLKEMVDYALAVPNSGLIGCAIKEMGWLPPLSTKDGIHAYYLDKIKDKVFGVTLFRREVVEKIGFFAEEFGPYGLEDSDFNNRVNVGGFQSLYVPAHFSRHLGNDWGQATDYRKMKDESLAKNAIIIGRRVQEYYTKGVVEPLPPMREPI